jgi:POT family proton-dependent oligopeptide transporter
MMGFAVMSLSVSNNLIGWIGGFYERMRPVDFWAMHAGIAATGGLLVMLFGGRLRRILSVEPGQPLRPAALTLEVER